MIQINKLPPFKQMCCTIGNLPTSFMESMTYYEALEWLYKYLSDTIIPTINTTNDAVTELQGGFKKSVGHDKNGYYYSVKGNEVEVYALHNYKVMLIITLII